MDLESLLNASLDLEKRIATDKALRRYFASVWKEELGHRKSGNTTRGQNVPNSVSIAISAEIYELVDRVARQAGVPPAKILEESFLAYLSEKLRGRPT